MTEKNTPPLEISTLEVATAEIEYDLPQEVGGINREVVLKATTEVLDSFLKEITEPYTKIALIYTANLYVLLRDEGMFVSDDPTSKTSPIKNRASITFKKVSELNKLSKDSPLIDYESLISTACKQLELFGIINPQKQEVELPIDSNMPLLSWLQQTRNSGLAPNERAMAIIVGMRKPIEDLLTKKSRTE